jgi:hypothetical protein
MSDLQYVSWALRCSTHHADSQTLADTSDLRQPGRRAEGSRRLLSTHSHVCRVIFVRSFSPLKNLSRASRHGGSPRTGHSLHVRPLSSGVVYGIVYTL